MLKAAFKDEVRKTDYSQLNNMGLITCQAAYEYGAEWLSQLKQYLLENLNYTKEYFKNNISQLKLVEAEGTYPPEISAPRFRSTRHRPHRRNLLRFTLDRHDKAMLKCFYSTKKLKIISVPTFCRHEQRCRALFVILSRGGGSLPKNYKQFSKF